jgi:glutamine amidotransferase
VTVRPGVVVLDYGSGNIHSATKALERAGADVTVTADRQAALAADGLVVPGVGAFRAVMDQLDTVRGGDLVDRRLAGSKPVLGVCVGMQVMFDRGLERGADVEGLGQWPGTIRQLTAPVLPHMGWNTVEAAADSVLFEGLTDERFYFVHSYGATSFDLDPMPPFPSPRVTWAEHGERFVAAVENGALSATQFHPEKSGEPGIALLRNWLRTL